jgi:hypothetical protein
VPVNIECRRKCHIKHQFFFIVVGLPVCFSPEVASCDIVKPNTATKPSAQSHTDLLLFNDGRYVVPSNCASCLAAALGVYSATFHQPAYTALILYAYISIYIYTRFQNVTSVSVSIFYTESKVI